MKHRLIILLLIGFTTSIEPQTTETKIASSDFILIIGKVMHCDDWGEFMIEYGQVIDHKVKILHHHLKVVDLSSPEFEQSLKEAIFHDTGHWPLLSIKIFSEGEFRLNQDKIKKEIDMYYEAIDAGDKKVEEFKKRSKSVGMYNKSFKYFPGLRPSTGHKNATHSCAA